MEITHCRLNHLENPLGYRLAHTAFSWQVEGSRAETARLVVAADPGMKQVRLQFSEVLQDGNFYRSNLGSARTEYLWTSNGQDACLQPHFTFYGYRYVKVEIPDLRP